MPEEGLTEETKAFHAPPAKQKSNQDSADANMENEDSEGVYAKGFETPSSKKPHTEKQKRPEMKFQLQSTKTEKKNSESKLFYLKPSC